VDINLLAVGAVIIAASIHLFALAAPHVDTLWHSSGHDRNGHYQRSQAIALALRSGDVGGFVKELHAATVWPPGHALAAGLVMVVGGVNASAAVVASLGAWAATALFAFLLARRLAPRGGDVAGWAAALFVLASPAHRAYATDVMIESFGAGLTTACLFCYVAMRQGGPRAAAWGFAILLYALFQSKYNYFTLVASGLVLATVWEFRSLVWAQRERLREVGEFAKHQAKHPFTWLLAAALAACAYVKFFGPIPAVGFTNRTEVGKLDTPLLIAWWLFVLRVLPWCWREGRTWLAVASPSVRAFAYGFVVPTALTLMWPRRFGVFVWSVTCTQHGTGGARDPWLGSAAYYTDALCGEYHANTATCLIAMLLAVVGLVACLRGRAGAFAVVVTFLIAAALTNYHSANRMRFLMSWISLLWVFSGVGIAVLAHVAFGRWGRKVVAYASVGTVLALAGWLIPSLISLGHAEEGGVRPGRSSQLPLLDAVADDVGDAMAILVVSRDALHFPLTWRLTDRRGVVTKASVVSNDWLPAEGDTLRDLLASSRFDAVVVLDEPHMTAGDIPFPTADAGRFRPALAASPAFTRTAARSAPAFGPTSYEVWRRQSPR
jgi:hypothetical protein